MHLGTDTVHYAWDRDLAPALEIEGSGTVELDLLDSGAGQFDASSTHESLAALDFTRVNPVTGPILVRGAEPGDALLVRVRELGTAGWGWSANIPGFGLLAEDFPDPVLVHSRIGEKEVELDFGPVLPALPMIGTLGLALPEPGEHPLLPPSRHGGNMDIRQLGAGSSVLLPVGVPGALLSLGDGHAAMGDGEICGTGVETSARAVLEIELVKERPITAPVLETPAAARRTGAALVTTGIGPDLHRAAKDAARSLVDETVRRTGLSAVHAYILASLTADLIVSEIVDLPNYVVSMHLPIDVLS
ncbi:acetamidase/formamidase family protein [Actinospica sp. MGRD01-02]|uniref:Acetamidase/formamidase family protein n=1 Tax=Actinospica acidithermotolerans TaxID=2828514 RepID=A0A941ED82_9ACTN|nr:acetamidase/formamidase family protein [Actinospica acidithermotolerans]MBR7829366.1 acetamidase/formamidase family protein [Actinospica acidithermotolerans]